MGASSLREDGLQLAQALGGDSITNAIVLVDSDDRLVPSLRVDDLGLDGNNLGLELAVLLSLRCLLEGLGGKVVLLGTSDVVLLGDVLTWERREVRSATRRRACRAEGEDNALVIPMGKRQSAAASHSRTDSDICVVESNRLAQ